MDGDDDRYAGGREEEGERESGQKTRGGEEGAYATQIL